MSAAIGSEPGPAAIPPRSTPRPKADPTTDRGMDLAGLLHPIPPERFLQSYWQRAPLVIGRGRSEHFAELLDLDRLETLVTASGARAPFVRLVRDGVECDGFDATFARSAAFGTLADAIADGASLIVQFLHERCEPIAHLASRLSAELSAGVQANAYLTPPGARALADHRDGHAVFVLQLEGSKSWHVRAPMPSAIETSRSHDAHRTPSADIETTLEPGDLLYIPAGFVHGAACRDRHSLHLTLGLHSVTWAQLLRRGIESAIAGDAGLLRALPPGFATDPDVGERAASELERSLRSVARTVSARSLVAAAAADVIDCVRPPAPGRLAAAVGRTTLEPGSRLSREPHAGQALLTADEGIVEIGFRTKRVRFPSRAAEALRFVLKHERFALADVPGPLDADGNAVLVRRLVREGLLRITDDA